MVFSSSLCFGLRCQQWPQLLRAIAIAPPGQEMAVVPASPRVTLVPTLTTTSFCGRLLPLSEGLLISHLDD